MIATEGPRNQWAYCTSPAHTLQETLKAKHWPKTNLTPDPSSNGVMADTHIIIVECNCLFSKRSWSTELMDQLDESLALYLKMGD